MYKYQINRAFIIIIIIKFDCCDSYTFVYFANKIQTFGISLENKPGVKR